MAISVINILVSQNLSSTSMSVSIRVINRKEPNPFFVREGVVDGKVMTPTLRKKSRSLIPLNEVFLH